MDFLCNMLCQDLFVIFFSTQTVFRYLFHHKKVILQFSSYIKWDFIISLTLRLLFKVWIQYRWQNRIKKYYYHDGEQLGEHKHIKTQKLSKKENFL